jgi:D-xylose 1-dehydrogenase (NADP+, D-xylono-1,5-lactone-forming)
MPEKVRWGVISTANIGTKRVIPAIQASRNGEVVAIASRDRDRAQAAAQQLGIPRAYGSYEELIADPEVDAIYNPLPNSMHAEWSIQCAEAGKPTLCEKPFARDAPEAQLMVNAFVERNVLFAEAFMYRFHPQTQKVKALVDAGAIGKINVMNASFDFALGPGSEANIRLSKELVGGGLMDVGCYCINIMRLLIGEEPHAGHAFAQIGAQTRVDETLAAVLEFPSGAVGHFDCSLRSGKAHTYDVRGTQGRIQVAKGFVMDPDREMVIEHWQPGAYSRITIPPANSYTLMAEDFADALLNNRPPRYAPQDGVDNMQVIDMLVDTLR